METVANQFRRNLFPLQSGPDGTRFPVQEGRHGIVQVCQVYSPRRIDRRRFGIACGGVGYGNRAQTASLSGKRRRTGQFRGQVHNPDNSPTPVIKVGKRGIVRRSQIGAVLRPPFRL